MKKTVFLIILMVLQLSALAQKDKFMPKQTLDSLEKLLPESKGFQRIEILNRLASGLAPVSFDSSLNYGNQALMLATQNGYPAGIGLARLYIGNAYFFKVDLRNALLSYLAALKILEESKPLKELGDLYLQLGHINYSIGRFAKAISFYQSALETFRTTGNEQLLSYVFFAISYTYWRDQKNDSTIFYSRKLRENAIKLRDRYLEGYALEIEGMAYLSEVKSIESLQKSSVYFNQALEIGTELKDNELISVSNLNLGAYYYRGYYADLTANLVPSRSYFESANQAAIKAKSLYVQAKILNTLANIDIVEGKYNQAEIKLNLCESKLDSFFLTPEKNIPVGPYIAFGKMFDLILAQQDRTLLYAGRFSLAWARKDYKNAIGYMRSYYQYKDSLFSKEQARQFDLMMVEADKEKADQKIRILLQENELKQLNLSRTRLLFAGIGASALIVTLFLLLFFQRKRMLAEQKSLAMEQRLLRAQMNPHFLFNSLASIQNYIINEKTDQATLYLSRFSQLVRNVLDNSAEEVVSLENEVDAIQNYLELQKVRYAGKFDFRMTVDELIDQENTMIPPMLAQPFIENAIEHGIRHKEIKGNIEIRFLLEGELIRFEVEDDGVGRDKAFEIETRHNRNHRSMSTSITRERLLAMNKKLKKKLIRMEIIDLKDAAGEACGTKVTFGIPFKVGSRQ